MHENNLEPAPKLTAVEREYLHDFPETASEALSILRQHAWGKSAKERVRSVVKVLRERSVPIPEDFPCSDACQQYGTAIAEKIMAAPKKPPTKETKYDKRIT